MPAANYGIDTMGIRNATPRQAVADEINVSWGWYLRALIRKLKYCGEACLNQARDSSKQANPYMDQTNNMRSSTGYIIAMDGNIVFESAFDHAGNGTGGDGSKGRLAGKDLAEKLAKGSTGVCLIVVAGMEYATYVANKGYDVLASAELLANKIVPKMLAQLNSKSQ